MRALSLLGAVPAIMASLAAAAAAAPPANDDYRNAARVENLVPSDQGGDGFGDVPDTREATVQADLLAPAGSGGGAEVTSCAPANAPPVLFGRTVWYRLDADALGYYRVETFGFDTVFANYYATPPSLVPDFVNCVHSPGQADFENVYATARRVREGTATLVAIGGVDTGLGPASGPLQVRIRFFSDRDLDRVSDATDRCPRTEGLLQFGGCPPRLRAAVGFEWTSAGNGIRVTRLLVRRLAAGSGIAARCVRGCRASQVIRSASGTRRLRRFVGLRLRRGARFEVRVTHPPRSSGAYEFGAIGNYFRFDVRAGGVRRIERCLRPGSNAPSRDCTV